MKFKKHFESAIKKHLKTDHPKIMAELEDRFVEIEKDVSFAKTSPNPMDKRLEFIGYFLAFIQTLEANRSDYEQIREISLEIAYEYVKPKSRFHAWLKKMPMKFVDYSFAQKLLAKMNSKLIKRGHENGFVAEVITDKEKTLGLGYGINILECGVCKLFNKYEANEYTSILCDVDKITTGFAGLELVLTGTISRGAPVCDFRYKLN